MTKNQLTADEFYNDCEKFIKETVDKYAEIMTDNCQNYFASNNQDSEAYEWQRKMCA